MAIIPGTRYTGRMDVDAAYPQGKAKNVTNPNDGTGTPLEKGWVNDLFGWEQALLLYGGVVPSATEESANVSQYLEASMNIHGAVFDTVADLVTDTRIKVGQRVATLGYNTKGDGGASVYEVVADGTGVADAGEFIALTGLTLQAKLIHNGVVVPEQYGATGDGATNDTTALNAALAAFDSVKLSPGKNYVTTGMSSGSAKYVFGGGRLTLDASATPGSSTLSLGGSSTVEGIVIVADAANNPSSNGINITGASGVVQRCRVSDVGASAIRVVGDNHVVTENVIANTVTGVEILDGSRAVVSNNTTTTATNGVQINASASGTRDDISINGNTMSAITTPVLVTEVSGTVGNRCVAKGNTWGGAVGSYDIADIKANTLELTGIGDPESVHTAGVGSTFKRTDGAAGTSFYTKTSGTGNTGWSAVAVNVTTPTINRRVFTTSGSPHNWSVPAGVTRIKVELQGAGGGGGDEAGGGGGGYWSGTINTTPTNILTFTVGSGGARGIGAGASGSDGDDTTLTGPNGLNINAGGGTGGSGVSDVSSPGGTVTPSGSDIVADSSESTPGGLGDGETDATPDFGGASRMGGLNHPQAGGSGLNSGGYGAGGVGSAGVTPIVNNTDGSPGLAIVEWIA